MLAEPTAGPPASLNRRISLIAGRSGEGLLTKLAAVARPGARELVVHAPFRPCPQSLTLSRSDFAKRGLSVALKKGPRLVVLRLLRLWPFLLLTPYRRARAAN